MDPFKDPTMEDSWNVLAHCLWEEVASHFTMMEEESMKRSRREWAGMSLLNMLPLFHLMSTTPFRCLNSGPSNEKKKILDPQGPLLQKWNKIFVISCVAAVYIDPLFFYIPVVNEKKRCLDLDKKLQMTACILRFSIDVFYILHIIFQFRTGFLAPSSQVFGGGALVEDPIEIAKRYLSSYFLIDVLAVLPLPQVLILGVIPKLKGSEAFNTKNLLRLIVLLQYVPRFLRFYSLYQKVTRTSGIITETASAGAALNFFLYMLASHIFGALWYLLSIEREDTCWRRACRRTPGCHTDHLYCGDYSREGDNAFLDVMCSISSSETTPFNFGIYLVDLQSGVVKSRDFPQKLLYCFWWGLRSLSSLGQNLETSTYAWEVTFATSISVVGLLLFALLLGNMQKYMQFNAVRLEEIYRAKRLDTEQWMSHRMLPDDLRNRIRRYEQYKWQKTRGFDEENLLQNLPKDLRLDVKRHLCLALLMRVPIFEKMDDKSFDAMCDRVKPVLYNEDSYIVREGDPVHEMVFIMRGKLISITTNGGRAGFFNSVHLKAGDFCGEELLTWVLDPHPSMHLPISTRTVCGLTEVEGFALRADDLQFVASQFRRLHSRQWQHIFRFYSHQWRTWATCFIQAAWRRHCKRKLEKSLREEQDRMQNALTNGVGSSPSLGASIYASRFAANALRAVRHKSTRNARLQEGLPPRMILAKPSEPDFTAEVH